MIPASSDVFVAVISVDRKPDELIILLGFACSDLVRRNCSPRLARDSSPLLLSRALGDYGYSAPEVADGLQGLWGQLGAGRCPTVGRM